MKTMIIASGRDIELEVDGGVDDSAGAGVLVAESCIFKRDYKERIGKLKEFS